MTYHVLVSVKSKSKNVVKSKSKNVSSVRMFVYNEVQLLNLNFGEPVNLNKEEEWGILPKVTPLLLIVKMLLL